MDNVNVTEMNKSASPTEHRTEECLRRIQMDRKFLKYVGFATLKCQTLLCDRDVVDEVETYECSQCSKIIPKRNAALYRHCCYQCYDCPQCGQVLSYGTSEYGLQLTDGNSESIKTDSKEHKAVASSHLVLFCQYCTWMSEGLGIITNDTEELGAQLLNMYNARFSLEVPIFVLKSRVEENQYEVGETECKAKLSLRKTNSNIEDIQTENNVSIWNDLYRIGLYETEEKDIPRFQLDASMITTFKKELKLNLLDPENAVSLDKILKNPYCCMDAEYGQGASKMFPISKKLRICRSRRCKQCQRYVVRRHPSSCSLFRLNQTALAVLPLVTIKKFSPESSTSTTNMSHRMCFGEKASLEIEFINLIDTDGVIVEFVFDDPEFIHSNSVKCLSTNLCFTLEAWDEYVDQDYQYQLEVVQSEEPKCPTHRKTFKIDVQATTEEVAQRQTIANMCCTMKISTGSTTITCHPIFLLGKFKDGVANALSVSDNS